MKNATIILAVLAVVALGAPAYGGTWEGDDPVNPNDWHTGENWDGGSEPIGSENAIFKSGTAVISAGATCYNLYLGYGYGYGHVEMTGGLFNNTTSGYTACPWLQIGYATNATHPVSTFIISGGTLDGGTRVNVGNGGGGKGEFTISAGSLTMPSGYVNTYPGSTFRVIGSGATKVDIAGKSGADLKFDVEPGGILNMQLDNGTSSEGNSGITRIKVHNTYAVTNPNYDLDGIATFESGSILDMGWETGTTPTVGTYLLLVADIIMDNGLALKAGQDVADGGDWDIVWGTDGDSETLSVTYVPEPATLVLLGLGGIGVLIRRKRR